MNYWTESLASQRRALVGEVDRVEDFGRCFDLSAFPLPLRVALLRPGSFCLGCNCEALHVLMDVRPRSDDELPGCERRADGTVELGACTGVTQELLQRVGKMECLEKVRVILKTLVLHEVYEATLFRGERIYDPHSYALRPEDQPW